MNDSHSLGASWPARLISLCMARRLRACLVLVLLVPVVLGLAVAPEPAPVAAAADISFPPYVYVATSGQFTYDLMKNVGGKESRVARLGVAGVGLSDVTARMAADGQHAAVRVSGDRAGGSSLQIFDIKTSRPLTVTLSRNADIGIGAFAWSPDSKSLAYTVASPQRADADSGSGVIWVVSADGKGARKVGGSPRARLIGWSPDGTGVYFVRDGATATDPVDLWFLSLTGKASPVLRSSPGGLQYRLFAVAPSLVAGGTTGAARVAALASGDLSILPPAGAANTNVPRSRPAPRMATDDTPGLVAGDGLGGYQPMKDGGEQYRVLAWNSTGTHILFSGGKSNKAWFADARTGQRWPLPATLNNLAPVVWSNDGRYVVMGAASGATTSLITFDTATGRTVRSRGVGSALTASKEVQNLPIPYISQLWDTDSGFNGNWACGPTTVAMVLSYYGRLTPWPLPASKVRLSAQDKIRINAAGVESSQPDLMDGHLYGQYVTAPFNYKGRTFTTVGTDPAGHKVQGLYGAIVGTSTLAHWERMIDVLNLYGLSTDYIPVSWAAITAQLDKGNPVVLGTTLTTSGHILVARGYTANGYLLVNDPYGNGMGRYGYGGDDGGNAAYAWKKIPAKLAMVVRGTITPVVLPTPSPTASPTPAASPTPVPTFSAGRQEHTGTGGP